MSPKALVYLYDIFPTLLGIAGVTEPEGVEGKDLGAVWRGETTKIRDTLFTSYEDIQRAVRDDRWKLIRYPQIDHAQLFDLDNDPPRAQQSRRERRARVRGRAVDA